MGIPGYVHMGSIQSQKDTDSQRLREEIKACEEIVPKAKLAEEHFRENGRLLRIAVDEADWRSDNVSPEKVASIRRNTSKPPPPLHLCRPIPPV